MIFRQNNAERRRDRPPCTAKIHVQEGLKTRSARDAARRRERDGIPINQCGQRGDFLVDDKPMCRAHAAACALAQVLNSGGE